MDKIILFTSYLSSTLQPSPKQTHKHNSTKHKQTKKNPPHNKMKQNKPRIRLSHNHLHLRDGNLLGACVLMEKESNKVRQLTPLLLKTFPRPSGTLFTAWPTFLEALRRGFTSVSICTYIQTIQHNLKTGKSLPVSPSPYKLS